MLLEEAGWAVLTVSTSEGIAHHAAHAQAVIVRLGEDTSRLHAVEKVLREVGIALPHLPRGPQCPGAGRASQSGRRQRRGGRARKPQ